MTIWSERWRLGSLASIIFSMALVAGCGGDGAPISAANTKYQAADSAEPAGDETDVAGDSGTSAPPVDPMTSPGPNVRSASAPPTAANNVPAPHSPSNALGSDPGLAPPTAPPVDLATQLLEVAKAPLQNPENARTQQEMVDQLLSQVTNKMKAAEKVLALGEQAAPAQRTEAMELKLGLLSEMVNLGVTEADKHIREFVDALENDPQEDIARKGRMFGISIRMGEYTEVEDADFEPLKQRLTETLADKQLGIEEAQAYSQAALQLIRAGNVEEGQQVVEMLNKRFAGGDNLETNQLMAEIAEQASIFSAGFESKRDAFVTGSSDESLVAYVDMAKGLLDGDGLGMSIFEATRQAALDLERAGNLNESKEVYGQIVKAYEGTQNERLSDLVKDTVDAADRRFALVGSRLKLDDQQLHDGKPLDPAKYAGKHVLIHFWSPMSQASMQEFQYLLQVQKQFKDRGLEILGVAVADPAMVKQFFAIQSLPWDSLVDTGKEGSLTDRSGVTSLPFSILLNPEGVVEQLYVMKPTLMDVLEKALPAGPSPATDPAAPSPSADPAAADPAAAAPAPASAAPEDGAWLDGDDDVQFVALWDDTTDTQPAEAKGDTEGEDAKEDAKPVNPYLPREGLSTKQLINYIFDMEDRPKSIRARPGFSEALVVAADKVLADKEAKEAIQLTAIETKFWALHRLSVAGNEAGDKQLAEYVKTMSEDERTRVAVIVEFLKVERRVLAADDLELDEVPDLLEEALSYCEEHELTEKHLRFASGIVHAVNRLEDGEEREEWFKAMGDIFTKSDDRQLARYGKRIAKSKAQGGFPAIGQQMELAGVTVNGLPFDWSAYKGKVIVVDFWATWCGPCVREMPNVQAFYRKHKVQGLEIVGVSLDKDLDAVAAFVEDKKIPWETLVGEDNQEIATKYGVRGIPTMMLIDRSGKVVAAAHNIAGIAAKAKELLENET